VKGKFGESKKKKKKKINIFSVKGNFWKFFATLDGELNGLGMLRPSLLAHGERYQVGLICLLATKHNQIRFNFFVFYIHKNKKL